MDDMEKICMTEDEARTLVLDYKSKTGKSQSLIATELGISGAQLSSFISGTYKARMTKEAVMKIPLNILHLDIGKNMI